jgi:FkbM family methyltransferase
MPDPLVLSYTQNLEDYHLSLAFAGQQTGTYLDVGAGHPVADNVSFWFYERGWKGVVVEPQPELAALYARLRPRDAVVCGLVGRERGETDFNVVERLHGLSTTIEKYAQQARTLGAGCRVVRMPVTTLAEVCEHHGLDRVDFLKIDVEGAEKEVLLGNDWTRFRPRVLLIEALAPLSNEPTWEEWEPLLTGHGYRFALFDRLNRFYVAQEHPEILARIPALPAAWGATRHMYEIGRAPENPQHPDHALAQELARGFWATLPYLDREIVAAILGRARGISDGAELEALGAALDTDAFRAAIGRIACGYDGGMMLS